MFIAYRSRRCSALIGIATAALVSLASLRSDAQGRWDDDTENECEGPCAGPRTLGGHTFVPSTLVEWPFIVSRVASTTSVGFAEVDIGSQRLAMRLGLRGTDEFVSADQSILGSVAIAPWLSLALRAQGMLIIPTARAGAVFVGEHGSYGGSAVVALRLIRSGRFQATALVDGGRLRPTSVIPARLPGSPLEKGDLTIVRPALALAYAFTPGLGFQASASYAWQELEVT